MNLMLQIYSYIPILRNILITEYGISNSFYILPQFSSNKLSIRSDSVPKRSGSTTYKRSGDFFLSFSCSFIDSNYTINQIIRIVMICQK